MFRVGAGDNLIIVVVVNMNIISKTNVKFRKLLRLDNRQPLLIMPVIFIYKGTYSMPLS